MWFDLPRYFTRCDIEIVSAREVAYFLTEHMKLESASSYPDFNTYIYLYNIEFLSSIKYITKIIWDKTIAVVSYIKVLTFNKYILD